MSDILVTATALPLPVDTLPESDHKTSPDLAMPVYDDWIRQAFSVLLSTTDGEKSFVEMTDHLATIVDFVERLQGRFFEAMTSKESQYLAAFKEHLTAMSVQLETMRREVGRGLCSLLRVNGEISLSKS